MMVRNGFRTVQDGTLAQDHCPKCRGILYRVPEGSWLHWGTLAEECRIVPVPIGASKGQEGRKMAPIGLDTPERGLARARCTGSYRRPSWEWMACR